jgi:hypothetical protein
MVVNKAKTLGKQVNALKHRVKGAKTQTLKRSPTRALRHGSATNSEVETASSLLQFFPDDNTTQDSDLKSDIWVKRLKQGPQTHSQSHTSRNTK